MSSQGSRSLCTFKDQGEEMIIVDQFPQLSEEWFNARLGNPGASNFNKIVTTKGEPSKQAQDYMYQLAGELVSNRLK